MSHTEPGAYNPNASRENPHLGQEYRQDLESRYPGSTQPTGPLIAQDQPLPVTRPTLVEQPQISAADKQALADRAVDDDVLTLDSLRVMAAEYATQGLHRYKDPDLAGAFYLKALNGAEVEKVNKMAGDKPGEFNKWLIMEAVKRPEFGLVEYSMLNRISPGIKYRLLAKIRELAGMDDEALDKAKNVLPEEDTDSSIGTV